MGASFGKPNFSFHAKVILPVVFLLAVLLTLIIWLVNGRITDQFEDDSRRTLSTAEAVFRNSLEIRKRNLVLRYQSVANEPRFKAVAQLADSKTMSAQLKELLHESGPEARIMTFTAPDQTLLAIATVDRGIPQGSFTSLSTTSVRRAMSGTPDANTIAAGKVLLNAVSVPVFIGDSLAGVLTIGHSIGPEAASELKSLTRSEIVLFASDQVALSTIPEAQDHELRSIYIKSKNRKAPESALAAEEHYLSLSGVVPDSSGQIGFLLLSSYERALRKKEETQRTLTWMGMAGILFSSMLMSILIRRITQPLRLLRASAEAVGKGDFSRKVEVNTQDEFGELASVFNQMMENLRASQAEVQQAMQSLKDAQTQLIQTEKLSAMGKFVAGIAHELNNPLTGVIGFSQMLQESGMTKKQQTYLDRIVGSAERCQKIVQNLLSFSRRNRLDKKPVHIHDLIHSALEILDPASGGLSVELSLANDVPRLMLDPHQMRQVFLNIISNAKQATEHKPDGFLRIDTRLMNHQVQIQFSDNGVGIAEEDLPNVFNPFFTTKPVGAGTGLGLSLSYGIVHDHGGFIHAESQSGHGASFTVTLPVNPVIQALPADSTAEPSGSTPVSGNGKRILVIDDEEFVLELARESLLTHGYEVDTAASHAAAISLARNHSYDLFVCDWKMPDSGGKKIYEELQEISGKSTFLFITGDVVSAQTEDFLISKTRVCLQKPFSVDEFRTTVERLLT